MVHLLLVIIYLSFISLGLPDPLLGAAWPTMHVEFGVPVSYAGGISMIITFCTIISSLLSDRMTLRFGTGKITAFSVGLTAVALFGFSVSKEYWMLLLWAIPYGLGAGNVDASLNNYVALHYASRHMSWLHCMWGVGATVGPYVMGAALTGGMGWNSGYRYIALLQIVLSVILFLSLPIWKERTGEPGDKKRRKPLTIKQIFAIPGAKEVMFSFFCYCALETAAGLWASSYFVVKNNLSAEDAASFASLFYFGMTAGRAISGFLTYKLNDTQMVRLGSAVIAVGILVMLLPIGIFASIAGLVLIGLGCAPVYPCIIHSTPAHFGAENSQAIIGVQMASAYVGILTLPPLFGLIANYVTVTLLPFYLIPILVLMVIMFERLTKIHPEQ
ncbi:MAG: MFS transporter [Oscillospiraceae bacterium]|nr:MFS transporter [Oscillospiraceae bacterium]